MTDKIKYKATHIVTLFVVICTIVGCGTTKIETIRNEKTSAFITISDKDNLEDKYDISTEILSSQQTDTLTVVGLNGESLTLMRSVKDSLGNTYASETLSGVKITARFKNIAERLGKVDISFDIHIPQILQDPKWQLRFMPSLYIQNDTLDLDDVYITGSEYNESLLKGYEQYAKYLSSIITDSSKLRYQELIEIFIQRNIPTQTSFTHGSNIDCNKEMEGYYGVSYQQVLDYYQKKAKIGRNNLKTKRAPKVFDKYVKNRYTTDAIRLDSIITNSHEITYCYTQTIQTRPKLRKVDITISGCIMQNGKNIYTMDEAAPLTFYISSISTFAEERERYIKSIIERRAQANTQAYIDFRQGESIIDPSLHENQYELKRICENITSFIDDELYDIDSLVITASSSPEGSYASNEILSLKRGKAIKEYFINYANHYIDSLESLERGTIYLDLGRGGDIMEETKKSRKDFDIKVNTIPENWELLKSIISHDTLLIEKDMLLSILDMEIPLDAKESLLQKRGDYTYLREKIYPKLRCVKFDFHLHRKGMVKDTIHTTTLDLNYKTGVEALINRDYEQAINLLRPYQDINTAVAYLCMDYNASAKAILEGLPNSAKRDYLYAIIYSREGDEKMAIQSYLQSIEKDGSLKFRANLDPEISYLIKKYSIDKRIDQETDFEADLEY